jgi:hypothetical protein
MRRGTARLKPCPFKDPFLKHALILLVVTVFVLPALAIERMRE